MSEINWFHSEELSSDTCGLSNKFSVTDLQHPGASFYQEFTGYISYFLPYWANNLVSNDWDSIYTGERRDTFEMN